MYIFEVTTGGKALQFYASVRLDVRKKAKIMDGDEIMGSKTQVKVVKNKVAPPFKSVEFDIIFGEGIDKAGEIIDAAVSQNVIQKAGSWFSYKDQKLGQGRETVRQLLKDNAEFCKEIESQLKFE
jgi:recombination protein RecA